MSQRASNRSFVDRVGSAVARVTAFLGGLALERRLSQSRREHAFAEASSYDPENGRAESASIGVEDVNGRSSTAVADGVRPSETTWWRAGAINALALALALGLLGTIWLLARPIALLLAAIIVAEAVRPLATYFSRWLPRSVAIIAVYGIALLIIAAAVTYIGAMLRAQVTQLAEATPGLMEQAQAWLTRWDPTETDRVLQGMQSGITNASQYLISGPLAVVTSAFDIVLVVALSIYWLTGSYDLRRFTLSLFPKDRRGRVASTLAKMGQTMGGYVRGVALDVVIVGVTVYIGLLIIGVPYPLVLALVAGLGELFPMIGPVVAAVPAILVGLQDSPTTALVVLGFYVVLQQFESYVLLPYVVRGQADIPPGLVIFALVAGGAVGGILGALIAIPLAGALRVLLQEIAAPTVRDWSGAR